MRSGGAWVARCAGGCTITMGVNGWRIGRGGGAYGAFGFEGFGVGDMVGLELDRF